MVDLWQPGEQLGTTAMVLFVTYKLVNKWAGKFLDSQKDQASAMSQQAVAVTSLAQTVRDGQQDQREVLIAVRVLAEKMDQQKQYALAMDLKLDKMQEALNK